MPLKEKLEDKIQKHQKKMKEISLDLERLELEYQQILRKIAMTPQQIQEYIGNPENFSPPIWELLQNEKKKLDEKLELELSSVRDPSKLKEKFQENGVIQQHWLFVR